MSIVITENTAYAVFKDGVRITTAHSSEMANTCAIRQWLKDEFGQLGMIDAMAVADILYEKGHEIKAFTRVGYDEMKADEDALLF